MDETTNTNANPEAPAQGTPPAAPPPATPPSQPDPVEKFVGAVDKLGPNIDTLNSSVKSAATLLGAQVDHLKAMQESFDKEKNALNAKVAEVNARFDAMLVVQEMTAKQLAECTKKLDIATSKTVQEMIEKILSAIPETPDNPAVASQETNVKKGTDDFYTSFIDRYQKILKK